MPAFRPAAGLNLSERTRLALGEVLAGRRRGLRLALLFAGPAVVASVAAVGGTVLVVALNLVLLLQTAGVALPGRA